MASLPAILRFVAGLLVALCAAAHADDAEGCDEGQRLRAGLCLATEITLDGMVNLRGGVRQGAAAITKSAFEFEADLDRLAGLEGWSADVSILLIAGRQITPTRLGALAAASSIEAEPTIRLNEAWIQRSFGGWGSLRLGQQSADSEFAVAEGAINLVSGTFGWPVAFGSNLPGAGPGYPLPALAARLALGDPDEATGLRIAVFASNPAGRYGINTSPQRHNRFGLTFSLADGALSMMEFTTGGQRPASDAPRPWVAKLGLWHVSGSFGSPRYDNQGLPLASPASSGTPQPLNGDHGIYTVLESVVARDGEQALMGYLRALAQPADRNVVSFQIDLGLIWRAPFGRSQDALSLGLSHARIGSQARGFDRDTIAFGTLVPVRSAETLVELNYAAAVVPDRLWVQPLVQVFVNPGAGAGDERRSTTQSLPNAVLVGARAVLRF